ncbi:MAG: DUF2939 domain-containing protein [Hyphomicrobiaceae bacterium]
MTDDTVPQPYYAPRPFGSAQSDSRIARTENEAAHAPKASAPRWQGRWRRIGLAGLALFAVTSAAAYAASPLIAAWSIREAVRTGDSDHLRTAIDWPRVKHTLKVSMTRYALLEAGVESVADTGEGDQPQPLTDSAARPSLWERIKASYGRRVVDGMVESYVTPEGLPTLFKLRNGFNKVIGKAPMVAEDADVLTRIRSEWSRVRHVRFLSPTHFAIEMDDKFEAGRRIAGMLEFEVSRARIGWRLVSLEIKRIGATANATTSPSRFASR